MCVYKSETQVWCLLQSLSTLVLRQGLQLRLEIDDSAGGWTTSPTPGLLWSLPSQR